MDAIATIVAENSQLVVSGELNFETVVAVWEQSLKMLDRYPQVNIDLSKVIASNSAGLALLAEWYKYGKRQNKKVMFSGVPSQLQCLAKVSGIDFLL